jgi:glycerophosphoryl diester phosphodiesterase
VRSTLVIAHRTCPVDAPENSLEGIAKAVALGADGVEIDLRISLDQRPFLMHDWTMRRTTGWPLPLELTPSFLARRLHLKLSSERVPSLSAVLDALPAHMLLAVDVKTPWAVIPLLSEIKRHSFETRVLVWCQSAWAVRYVTKRAPSVEVAYLKDVLEPDAKRAFIEKAIALNAKAISAHWLAIESDFVTEAHARGLRVYSWHAGHSLEPGKLTAGLDGLITDFPVQARAALSTAGATRI